MKNLQQKSIEQYFADYNILDPDEKVKLLSKLTNIIYDRNMHVIWHEKADNELKKQQIEEGLKEVDEKIKEILQDFLEKGSKSTNKS